MDSFFFGYKRCPAKCKTTSDHRSIKFIELTHNHGINTGTKQSAKRKSSKATTDLNIKTELDADKTTSGVIMYTTTIEVEE